MRCMSTMELAKPWYQSKTIAGALVVIVVTLYDMLMKKNGLDVSQGLMIIVSNIFVIYGRLTAKHKLVKSKKQLQNNNSEQDTNQTESFGKELLEFSITLLDVLLESKEGKNVRDSKSN